MFVLQVYESTSIGHMYRSFC